jgi:hypothetical protein
VSLGPQVMAVEIRELADEASIYMGYEAGVAVEEGIVAGIQLGALPIFKNCHGQNLQRPPKRSQVAGQKEKSASCH